MKALLCTLMIFSISGSAWALEPQEQAAIDAYANQRREKLQGAELSPLEKIVVSIIGQVKKKSIVYEPQINDFVIVAKVRLDLIGEKAQRLTSMSREYDNFVESKPNLYLDPAFHQQLVAGIQPDCCRVRGRRQMAVNIVEGVSERLSTYQTSSRYSSNGSSGGGGQKYRRGGRGGSGGSDGTGGGSGGGGFGKGGGKHRKKGGHGGGRNRGGGAGAGQGPAR
jgi:hypothetical protein